MQASREEVARSLEGNWQEDNVLSTLAPVVFELQRAVDDYD